MRHNRQILTRPVHQAHIHGGAIQANNQPNQAGRYGQGCESRKVDAEQFQHPHSSTLDHGAEGAGTVNLSKQLFRLLDSLPEVRQITAGRPIGLVQGDRQANLENGKKIIRRAGCCGKIESYAYGAGVWSSARELEQHYTHLLGSH
jgi:hypothetical protein